MAGTKLERVTVWLPREEKDRIKSRADKLGISLSAYLADRATRDAPVYMAAAELAELQSLRFQLYKMGVNVNQIAAALNTAAAARAAVTPRHLEWLEAVATELRRRLCRLYVGLYQIRLMGLEEMPCRE